MYEYAGLDLALGYAAHLDRMQQLARDNPLQGLPGVRLRYDMLGERYVYPRPAGMRVRNTFIVLKGKEIPLRVYWPATEEPPPVILYMHGGGFVAGSHDSHDMIVAQLAQATGAAIVSVHYRRTPENPFPAAHEDCWEALNWTHAQGTTLGWDSSRMAVAGDSAGGLLSTAMCMLAKRKGGPRLRCQALVYGVFDMNTERPYYRTAKDTSLFYDSICTLVPAYLGSQPGVATDSLAVPLRASIDELRGLPPAYFLNAQYDPLLEEEGEYAALLKQADVLTTVEIVPGTMHGMLRAMDVCPRVRDAFDRLALALRQHLGTA
ncbi:MULTISPECIES: alpha/beta hydrolase [unclassified Variovorax]|uniref:alpha/beta hydrolase n=1 Tax=unclassified Variovorax TaxID=663243 RepID=UPI0032E55499